MRFCLFLCNLFYFTLYSSFFPSTLLFYPFCFCLFIFLLYRRIFLVHQHFFLFLFFPLSVFYYFFRNVSLYVYFLSLTIHLVSISNQSCCSFCSFYITLYPFYPFPSSNNTLYFSFVDVIFLLFLNLL